MNTQAVPPTINSATSASVTGTAPQLGAMIPGTTGGLPALSGLSVTQNPMAQQLQSMGRGDDKVLVHMTPEEVNSLQGLAMASGGSLTINPHTGLPEAGWLGKLLPTLLGFAGAAFGLPTWAIGLGGAAAGTIATGDLGKGLSMGLQAFGGASLAGGLGVGKAGDIALREATKKSAVDWATSMGTKPVKFPTAIDKFGAFARTGMPGGVLSKAAPMLAAQGLMSGIGGVSQSKLPKTDEENKFKYTPMMPGRREVRYPTIQEIRDSGGAEFQYFTPSNPDPVPESTLPLYEQDDYSFADGGVASAPPQGFNELVDYFGAVNPGAITASMYPTMPTSQPSAPSTGGQAPTTPVQGGGAGPGVGYTGNIPNFGGFDNFSFDLNAFRDNFERNQLQQLIGQQPNYETPIYNMPRNIGDYGISEVPYNFGTPTPDLTPLPTDMDYGYLNVPGVGTVQIPGFSGYEWNNIDWDTIARQQGYIPQSQAIQLNAPTTDLSGLYDRFGALESQLQQLPTQMPTYQEPDLSGIYDRLNQFDARLENLPETYDIGGELSGLYDRFGNIESQLQSLPRELPTYQQPDLSGIYDRFGALESRFNSMPSYQAPDLSGIYDRFGNIESQLQSLPRELPTYQQPDLSSIYDRFGAIESQLQSLPRELPTYQQPDLSGIYSRLDQLGSQVGSMPTYQAPDFSDIYSRLDMLNSRLESLPETYDMNADQYQTVGGFAGGGMVNMRDGSFVVDARTVSELGNGSSNAGMELLSRMGGKPVRGPGDGVSDSVKASIGGKQEARVARDEVIFPPEAVRRMGGGNEKRGTAKLYNLMEHAHKARKKAKRGQDTKVRSKIA